MHRFGPIPLGCGDIDEERLRVLDAVIGLCISGDFCQMTGRDISSLPDDILIAIFKIIAPYHSLDVFSQYTKPLLLLFVCKRWQTVCDPLLVRKLEVGHGGWHPRNEVITQLLVKFYRDPSLCKYVRILAITVNSLDPRPDTPIAKYT